MRRYLPLACSLVAVFAGWQRRWTSDDGFITLRVAGQIAAGHGPVYNRGERVEASTSVLWTWLLGLVRWVTGASLAWTALLLGIAFTAVGVGLVVRSSVRLWETLAPGAVVVPFGIVVPLSLSAFWDFTTAGLEGGFITLWLGSCWSGLVAVWLRCRRAPGHGHGHGRGSGSGAEAWGLAAAVVAGLGWLVRPDLLPASLAFLAAVVLMERPGWLRSPLRVAEGLALPAAYQLFRMGYFAAVEPNTAIAKEAGLARWGQGLDYLGNLVGTYWLWLPLLLIVIALCLQRPERSGRATRVLFATPLAAAVLQVLYTVRVGGDFMHARLLLPAVTLAVLPVAVLPLRGGPARALGPLLALGVWALIAVIFLRDNNIDVVRDHGIVDERGYYVNFSRNGHPVTTDDYAATPLGFVGGTFKAWEQQAKSPIFGYALGPPGRYSVDPALVAKGEGDVFAFANIGIVGEIIGLDAHLLDPHGLPDPVSARVRLTVRGRPGHEKDIPLAWDFAEFADPAITLPSNVSETDVDAARAALSCGRLARLRRDITGPVSLWRNVKDAWSNTTLRYPANPEQAQQELCHATVG